MLVVFYTVNWYICVFIFFFEILLFYDIIMDLGNVCVWMYVCMYACMYLHIYIYIQVRIWDSTAINPYTVLTEWLSQSWRWVFTARYGVFCTGLSKTKKVQNVPGHTLKTHGVWRPDSRHFDTGTRCRWVAISTLQPLKCQGRSKLWRLAGRLGGPQRRYGRCGEQKISL